MKKSLAHLMVAVALVCASMSAYATPSFDPETPDQQLEALHDAAASVHSDAEWAAFSDRLVDALQSDHDGLQQAAMQLVIQYGDQVNVRKAVHAVMHIYREGTDEDMRHLAVVTLAHMDSRLAMGFLGLSAEFEKSPAILHTIEAVLAARS